MLDSKYTFHQPKFNSSIPSTKGWNYFVKHNFITFRGYHTLFPNCEKKLQHVQSLIISMSMCWIIWVSVHELRDNIGLVILVCTSFDRPPPLLLAVIVKHVCPLAVEAAGNKYNEEEDYCQKERRCCCEFIANQKLIPEIFFQNVEDKILTNLESEATEETKEPLEQTAEDES